VVDILSQSRNAATRFFALQMLEETVKTRWVPHTVEIR
jgi:hypothetical protein